jgi:hypothetical protein
MPHAKVQRQKIIHINIIMFPIIIDLPNRPSGGITHHPINASSGKNSAAVRCIVGIFFFLLYKQRTCYILPYLDEQQTTMKEFRPITDGQNENISQTGRTE